MTLMESELDLSGILGTPPEVAPQPQKDNGRDKELPRARKVPLYVDIETIPDESRMELFGLDPLPPEVFEDQLPTALEFQTQSLDVIQKAMQEKTPPAGWLAALGVAENAAKKPRKGLFDLLAEVESRIEERRKLLSVTPEFCRIVALGAARGKKEASGHVIGDKIDDWEITERVLLEQFWAAAEECSPIVGFNLLHFDLPAIFIRSAILGVTPTRKFDLRPWGTDVIDLMLARWPKGGQKGLKAFCKACGGPGADDDIEGSQVFDLFNSEPAKLAQYVALDVERARWMHEFLKGFFC